VGAQDCRLAGKENEGARMTGSEGERERERGRREGGREGKRQFRG